MKEQKQGGPQPFVKKRDILVVAGLLVVALAAWLVFNAFAGQGNVANVNVIKGGSQGVTQISLAEEGIHYIEAALPVQLEVSEGRIRFINSVCPDHDCEHFGWLQRDGEWAACLPAGVTVTVEEK